MKTLCLTGINVSALTVLQDYFLQAGLTPSSSQPEQPITDLACWHQHVLKPYTEHLIPSDTVIAPGKLWEQLASEFFITQINTQLWGWADVNSVWLLDFWLNFDPHIDFILIGCSPQDALALAIMDHNTASMPFNSDDVISYWSRAHERMLNFARHYPERVLLVNEEACLQNPAALVTACNERWQMPLHIPATTSHLSLTIDPVADYLAQQWSIPYQDTISLYQELIANCYPIDYERVEPELAMDTVVTSYYQLRDRSAFLQQIQTLQDDCAQLEQHIATLTQQNQRGQYQRNVLKKSLRQTIIDNQHYKKQIERESEHYRQLKKREEAHQAAYQETHEENELLLLQLHQVQEELEHYFLQYQTAQQQNQAHDARWQQLMRRHPECYDYQTISAVIAPNSTSEHPTLTWQIQDFYSGERSIQHIKCDTTLVNDTAVITFDRAQLMANLLRWPLSAAADLSTTPVHLTVPDSETDPLAQWWFELAASDWVWLRSLYHIFATVLAQPDRLALPQDYPSARLRNALKQTRDRIDRLPSVVRYDQVTLKAEQVNPDYEHLWLQLTPFVFGTQRSTCFDVRLSCAIPPGQPFGHYPKLEFPASTADTFQNWFAESHDDHGAKLELRFACPSAMDMAVWQQCVESDQQLIAAIIHCLPNVLAQLYEHPLSRPWQDWETLLTQLRAIYLQCSTAVAVG
jgi:regulator of replication initiation timing